MSTRLNQSRDNGDETIYPLPPHSVFELDARELRHLHVELRLHRRSTPTISRRASERLLSAVILPSAASCSAATAEDLSTIGDLGRLLGESHADSRARRILTSFSVFDCVSSNAVDTASKDIGHLPIDWWIEPCVNYDGRELMQLIQDAASKDFSLEFKKHDEQSIHNTCPKNKSIRNGEDIVTESTSKRQSKIHNDQVQKKRKVSDKMSKTMRVSKEETGIEESTSVVDVVLGAIAILCLSRQWSSWSYISRRMLETILEYERDEPISILLGSSLIHSQTHRGPGALASRIILRILERFGLCNSKITSNQPTDTNWKQWCPYYRADAQLVGSSLYSMVVSSHIFGIWNAASEGMLSRLRDSCNRVRIKHFMAIRLGLLAGVDTGAASFAQTMSLTSTDSQTRAHISSSSILSTCSGGIVDALFLDVYMRRGISGARRVFARLLEKCAPSLNLQQWLFNRIDCSAAPIEKAYVQWYELSSIDSNDITLSNLKSELDALQHRIHYEFVCEPLLVRVFLPSGHSNSIAHTAHSLRRSLGDSQRLEWLGDQILSFVVARALAVHPLTRIRSAQIQAQLASILLSNGSLSNRAEESPLFFGKVLDRVFTQPNFAPRPSIVARRKFMADMVEALAAAIYIDGNIGHVTRVFLPILCSNTCMELALAAIDAHGSKKASNQLHQSDNVIQKDNLDPKSKLQDLVFRAWSVYRRKNDLMYGSGGIDEIRNPELAYIIEETTGSGSSPIFKVSVSVNNVRIADGTGRRRKYADRVAASRALEILEKNPYVPVAMPPGES